MIDDVQLAINGLFDTLGSVERDLGIPTGFFRSLLKENDWSFIIKIHAIIEAAVSQSLASVLDDRLLPIFQRLDLSDKRIGKIVFVGSLGILDETQRRFIHQLSELRNSIVHDISKIDFNLPSYMKSLDQNQRRSFLKTLTASSTEKSREWRTKLALENPKVAIWIVMVDILIRTTVTSMNAKLGKQIKELSFEKLQLLEAEQE